jgi:hypothetical protein
VVAAVLVGVALWIYLSLDQLVKRAIEHYGSEIIQAAVTVERAKLAPADGTGELRGLSIGNPKGFRTAHAATVGTIELAVDPLTVAKDVVLVKQIVVVAPNITYEPGARGSNFDAIQRNVEQYLGTDRSAAKRGRRLVVERLTIRGARLSYSPPVMTGKAAVLFDLPDIQLSSIGKGRGGVTPAELTKIVVDALVARMAEAIGRSAIRRGIGTLR